MCVTGAVVASWSLTKGVEGPNPFTVLTNSGIQWTHLRKTPLLLAHLKSASYGIEWGTRDFGDRSSWQFCDDEACFTERFLQGNIFTGVCHYVHGGGGVCGRHPPEDPPSWADNPLGRPPCQCMLGYSPMAATATDCTHPAGMYILVGSYLLASRHVVFNVLRLFPVRF